MGKESMGLWNFSLCAWENPSPRIMEIKIIKWDLLKLKSFLHSKGNNKQNKNAAYRLEENTCK